MDRVARQFEAKWLHNRRFIATIADTYPDWMVTVVFYTAMHAVQTLLATDGAGVPGTHAARNQTLKGTRRYQKIWEHYRPLYDAAIVARYHCSDDPGAWIPLRDVK